MILVQEHVRDRHRLVQQPTGIVSQIENEPFEVGHIELLERGNQLPSGGFVEGREAHVADAGLQKKGGIHGVLGDLIASHGEGQWLGVSLALDGQMHVGALGAFQQVGNFRGGQSFGGFIFHSPDDVPRTKAGLDGRRAGHRSQNDGTPGLRADGHPHAVVLAALVFAEQRISARIKKCGVRIENPQHAWDRTVVNGAVGIQRNGVIALNDRENAGELPNKVPKVIGVGGRGAYGGTVNPAEDSRKSQYSQNQQCSTPLRSHGNLTFARGFKYSTPFRDVCEYLFSRARPKV